MALTKKKRALPFSLWRRLSQAACLLIFLFLFIKTDYSGSDQLDYAVNILFRLDPLVAACTILAVKTFISLLLPSFFLIGLSLVLGRFFCGWACPLGTLIDLFRPPLWLRGKKPVATLYPRLRFIILFFVLTAAFFGFPLIGFVDPFSILVRGLTLSFYPAFNAATVSFFTFTYQQAPEVVNYVTEPVYTMLRQTVLPFSQKFYELAFFSFFILLSVFLLEFWQRRFFCRNICPLGALLGLLGRLSILKGHGGNTDCKNCRTCRDICRMGAIDEERNIHMDQCSLCLECVDECPRSIITFSSRKPENPVPFSLSRRVFAGSLAGGALLPLFSGVRAIAKVSDPGLIRPPGALGEKDFLGRCVRCGECMKVCIGNALQPTFLEAGIEGMFTPKLVSRVGYCEFNCTLCGQVCPTGAIRRLSLAEKHKAKIGHAFFDKNHCLPFAKGIPCIVCEEHCPTSDKAIKFKEATVVNDQGITVTVRQPYVVDSLCSGCGICENKCPIPGKSAILITSAGEDRDPEKALPANVIPYGQNM